MSAMCWNMSQGYARKLPEQKQTKELSFIFSWKSHGRFLNVLDMSGPFFIIFLYNKSWPSHTLSLSLSRSSSPLCMCMYRILHAHSISWTTHIQKTHHCRYQPKQKQHLCCYHLKRQIDEWECWFASLTCVLLQTLHEACLRDVCRTAQTEFPDSFGLNSFEE